MTIAIVTAEIAFWVFLLGGLVLRYLAKARRASRIVLTAVPLVDLTLVGFVAVDVARGAPPTQAHALACVYLGFTVAFGPSVIDHTDAWFRYRFAGGAKPVKPAKGSRAQIRALWTEWLRVVLAAVIAGLGLGLLILVEGRPLPGSIEQAAQQQPYWSTLSLLAIVTFVWFLAGPAFAGRATDRTT